MIIYPTLESEIQLAVALPPFRVRMLLTAASEFLESTSRSLFSLPGVENQ